MRFTGKKLALLQQIDNDRRITEESDYDFLYTLQVTLLLSLREQGVLTPMQHRYAEERMNQRRRERSNKARSVND